ncbi:MAG: hypothetical protein A7316_02375 [Candidatus Altiarchaeales archaeon WOR_SM1_86-2]|nr:MAG: hypothetical protein A7315_04655 [Candidatus Altiarchaeales archaeon WOR_SM1_79]ODS36905.1 MAG: hypothetical protein A7316_02375 [Candidatus Altiarchaeales archaeon WOR_SM1_86-2]
MFEEIKDIKPEKDDSRMLGAIAYAGSILISLLAPLLIYLIAREDKFARFHALQSLILGAALIVVFIVLWVFITIIAVVTFGLGAVLYLLLILLALAALVLYLYCAYLAYEGKAFQLPYITDFVLKNI